MTFDFDTQLPIRSTHSSKYGAIARMYGTDDPGVIPMWVADMDFAAPEPVRDAIRAEADFGYFGYYGPVNTVSDAVSGWMQRRHGWTVDPGAVRFTHGLISGYGDVITAFSQPGDGIILFSPVYHAFYRQIEAMGRVPVESPLVIENGRFVMDLDGLAASLKGHEKIVTFCSPHNPGGRIWSVDEIRALAAFCAAHDLILVSDEIHGDLTYPGATFVPTEVAAPDIAPRLVVLTAPSKAFNIAGGETGLLIAPDAGLRRALDKVILDRESSPNRFGMTMIEAAYTECDDWMDAVRAYLADNFRLFADRIGKLPGASVMEMQSTYLSWVDFGGTGMTDAELMKRLVTDARVAPSPGPQFGTGGVGHLRFNLALPRPTLIEAIGRIEAAFSDLQ